MALSPQEFVPDQANIPAAGAQEPGWAREGSQQEVWARLSCSGGTRARPSEDGWARRRGSGAENIPWPVFFICVAVALVSWHCTDLNGFAHPSIPAGWGSAAQPLGLWRKTHPWGHQRSLQFLQPACVSQPPVSAPGLQAPWDGEDEPVEESCPRSGADAA